MFQIRLKMLREEHKMSQVDLARLIGVGQSAVGLWESGRNTPKRTTLEKLADVFHVSVDYLLGRSDVRDEKSPPPDGSGLDDMLVNLLSGLSPAQIQRVKDFVSGMKAIPEAPASGSGSDQQ